MQPVPPSCEDARCYAILRRIRVRGRFASELKGDSSRDFVFNGINSIDLYLQILKFRCSSVQRETTPFRKKREEVLHRRKMAFKHMGSCHCHALEFEFVTDTRDFVAWDCNWCVKA